MIKRFHAVILILSILLMTVFMSFGYAALTDNLSILGNAHVKPKPHKGVIITNVELIRSSAITSRENEYILPTNHETSVNVDRTNGFITYKITVFTNQEKSGYNVIFIDTKERTEKVIYANCSDRKDCFHSPAIKNNGTIYCSPHDLLIKPIAQKNSAPITG